MKELRVSFKITEKELRDVVLLLRRKKGLGKLHNILNGVLEKKTKTRTISSKPKRKKVDTSIGSIEKERLRDSKYIVDYYNGFVSNDSIKISEKFRNELINEKATKAEKDFKAILKLLKIKYEFQHVIFVDSAGKFFIVDFYLPDYNVAIEIDGGYHFTDAQMIADNKRTRDLVSRVRLRKIIRFKNEDIYTNQEFADKVKRILETSGLARVNIKDYNKA